MQSSSSACAMIATAALVMLGLAVTPCFGNGYEPVCPDYKADGSSNVVLLPNPFNCSQFFYCVWSHPMLFSCPEYLHFNFDLNVCDWPENAGCTPVVQHASTSTETAEITSTEHEVYETTTSEEHETTPSVPQ